METEIKRNEKGNRTLDRTRKTDILTIDELESTLTIPGYNGVPKHSTIIRKISDMLSDNDIENKFGTCFISSSGNRNEKGIELVQEQENVHGEKALQAHIVRRVVATILMTNMNNEEFGNTIAVNYNQRGLELAYGPKVWACDNMCIFGNNIISTYGTDERVGYDRMIELAGNWIKNMREQWELQQKIITRMKELPISNSETDEFIANLQRKSILNNIDHKISSPFNLSEMNEFHRAYALKNIIETDDKPIENVWELYNVGTNLYKSGKTDHTRLFKDNNKFGKEINSFFMKDMVIE